MAAPRTAVKPKFIRGAFIASEGGQAETKLFLVEVTSEDPAGELEAALNMAKDDSYNEFDAYTIFEADTA